MCVVTGTGPGLETWKRRTPIWDSWYSLNESELVNVHIWLFTKAARSSPWGATPIDASSRHPPWTCKASKGPFDAADLSNFSTQLRFQDMHTNLLNTPNNNRCQWSYPWLHWWHCCHLLSTLWGIYSSSPALLHMIWESLWSLDCPNSNRWTPEEDVPSSDCFMGGFPQQEQCVLSEPRSRR